MFSRRKGLLIITILALLSVGVAVRVGQAQKPGSTKTSPAGHAVLASNVTVVSHAVGFAETRPVRELMVKGGQIMTPPITAGALRGITRATVFDIAAELDIAIAERELTRHDLYIADEAFLTGTAAEVIPMREKILDETKRVFKPEFLNRLDEIIVFHTLEKPDLMRIVDLEVNKVKRRLQLKEIEIALDNAAHE